MSSKITVGEFLFALGFSPPDMKPLERAQKSAERAVTDAQKKIASGAEDAGDAIAEVGKRIDALAKRNAKTISGVTVALEAVGKAAKDAAADFLGAWRDPEKLAESWTAALGRIRTGALAIGGAALGAATGIGAVVLSTAESDRELQNWSVRLGTTVTELSRLEQAAAMTAGEDGVDALRESLQTLRENLGELQGEGTGPALEALRDLGIGLDEIAGQEATVQLEILADALADLSPEAGIKPILELLGGGDGGKLLPFLRLGAEGMNDLAVEAERLGTVVTDDAAAASAELAREIGAVVATVKALVADLARGLMPAIRGYVQIAKQWIADNRELLRQRVSEWLDKIIKGLQEFLAFAQKLASGMSSLIEKLGGLESALTIAAVAFGALQVAALGIPGVVLAASAALAIGITQLAGYRQEAELLQRQIDDTKARGDRAQAGVSSLERLEQLQISGELGDLSAAEYREVVTDYTAGLVAIGKSEESIERELASFDKARERQAKGARRDRQRASAVASSDADLFSDVRSRLAARNKRKKLGLGDVGVETALTAFKSSFRETGSKKVAADAAAAALDALAGKGGGGGGGKKKVDTSAADEAFGAELRRLAERDGLGEGAVSQALEAGAASLKGDATTSVARNAALGVLGSKSGKDYTTKASGDPLLSAIFGTDVPDIELSSIARGAEPQVLISNITNNLTVNNSQQISGAGDPSRVGDAAAGALRDAFQLAVSSASRTVKPKFAR